jgi:hypothetical protein
MAATSSSGEPRRTGWRRFEGQLAGASTRSWPGSREAELMTVTRRHARGRIATIESATPQLPRPGGPLAAPASDRARAGSRRRPRRTESDPLSSGGAHPPGVHDTSVVVALDPGLTRRPFPIGRRHERADGESSGFRLARPRGSAMETTSSSTRASIPVSKLVSSRGAQRGGRSASRWRGRGSVLSARTRGSR